MAVDASRNGMSSIFMRSVLVETREAILAMKELWTKDEAEFNGKYYDFPPVISFPKPLRARAGDGGSREPR
ncbi:MAG TPA: hypothetical protein VNW89_11700, partial [Stellaceae bacterium]|nr:hypothetical protein [Stellaceae bacterium]